jgi:alpha-tubulin suppressor-like RCC1 family protein
MAPVALADMGVLTGKTVTAVAATANSNLALCADGTLATWAASQSSIPVSVKTTGALAGKTVAGIAAAAGHNLAVCSDGTVVAWGDGGYGQLGNGGDASSSDPVPVSLGGKSVVSVAAGGYHSLAACSDGSVLAWGGNDRGQLGDGSTTDRNVPVVISNTGALAGKTVVAVSAGLQYSLALCSDGTLAVWGTTDYGILHPTTGSFLPGGDRVPRIVNKVGALAGKTVVALSQAAHSTPTVLCSDGTVVTWGLGSSGQRGDPNSSTFSNPNVVSTTGALSGKSIFSVTSGGSSSLAVCDDGSVVTWGSNSYGQLGNANFTASGVPVPVTDNGVLTGGKPLCAALAYHAIVVVAESDEGYRGWTFEQPALAQKGASADPDGDNIPNALEYVLRGDPTVSSTNILPTVSADGGNFVFEFTRLAASADSASQVFQYSADMVNWIDLPIVPSGEVVVGTADANGNQEVSVTVPKGANTQLFGRLKVALP